LLRYKKTGLLIAILLARYQLPTRGEARWIVDPHPRENGRTTVVALLDERNLNITRLLVFARFGAHTKTLRQDSELLKAGIVVDHHRHLLNALTTVRRLTLSQRLSESILVNGRGIFSPAT
jgi:hypothetical protein